MHITIIMIYSHKLKFYSIIIFEIIFFPFLFIFYEISNRVTNKKFFNRIKYRASIENDSDIYFHVHEWGGYSPTRKKN